MHDEVTQALLTEARQSEDEFRNKYVPGASLDPKAPDYWQKEYARQDAIAKEAQRERDEAAKRTSGTTTTVTPPKVAANETVVWWQWTQATVAHEIAAQEKLTRKHVAKSIEELMEAYRDVFGQVLATERKDVIARIAAAVDPLKGAVERTRENQQEERERREQENGLVRYEVNGLRELVEQQRALNARATNLDRAEVEGLGRELAAQRQQLEREQALQLDLVKAEGRRARELALLREELALDRNRKALHDEIDVARGEIDAARASIPDSLTEIGELRAENTAVRQAANARIKALEDALEAEKKRLSRVQVEGSLTKYAVTELEKKQTIATAVQLETSEAIYTLRLDPAAAKTLQNFSDNVLCRDGTAPWIGTPTGQPLFPKMVQ